MHRNDEFCQRKCTLLLRIRKIPDCAQDGVRQLRLDEKAPRNMA